MRIFLSLLFAVLVPLNAAYAAVVGVCDVMRHTQEEAVHFGHHQHDHGHEAPPAEADPAGQPPVAGDHLCVHVHPGFSVLLPGGIGLASPAGRGPYVAAIGRALVSTPPARLDRPPKTALA